MILLCPLTWNVLTALSIAVTIIVAILILCWACRIPLCKKCRKNQNDEESGPSLSQSNDPQTHPKGGSATGHHDDDDGPVSNVQPPVHTGSLLSSKKEDPHPPADEPPKAAVQQKVETIFPPSQPAHFRWVPLSFRPELGPCRIVESLDFDAVYPHHYDDESDDEEEEEEEEDDEAMILAVDATPTKIAGYLLNPSTNTCEYYSLPMDSLPWRLNDASRRGSPTEFEMKNLVFALLKWSPQIVDFGGPFFAYTDNSGINSNVLGSYGFRVKNYIDHLTTCCGVQLRNLNQIYLHPHNDPVLFDTFIVPADHLSRGRVTAFYNHVSPDYTILDTANTGVESQISYWKTHQCPRCGYSVDASQSLKRTQKPKNRRRGRRHR